MAQDIFAPKSSFDIAYERPLEPVRDNTAKIRTDFQAMAIGAEARAVSAQANVESTVFSGINAGLNIAGDVMEAQQDANEKGTVADLFSDIEAADQQAEQSGMSYEERRASYGKAVQDAASKLPNGYADLAKYNSALKAKTGLILLKTLHRLCRKR